MSAIAPGQGAEAPFSAPPGPSDSRTLRQRLHDSYDRVAAFLRDPLSRAIDDMVLHGFPLEVRREPPDPRLQAAREYLREASKRHPEWNVRKPAP